MVSLAKARYRLTTRALEARVRRRLSHEGEILRKCRDSSRSYHDLGDYYATDLRNCVVQAHIDLESLAREYGVLRSWETIED